MTSSRNVAVIGGGPAGLMAAETFAAAGCSVTVYDRMPSLARKFLMAGIGGLNLTHSEAFEAFAARYRGGFSVRPALDAFGPSHLREWCEGLGQETFVGTSGRIFPKGFKASPLLRAWLQRLERSSVRVCLRHRWTGWHGEALLFDTPDGKIEERFDAVLLALGGASWPRLGSDGTWRAVLENEGVESVPFGPSNCGFVVGWEEHVGSRFAGVPLKPVALCIGDRIARGEVTITRNGIEGGAVYALSGPLRDAIATRGHAVLQADLRPDSTAAALSRRLAGPRKGDSAKNRLRKLGLTPASIAVLREGHRELGPDPDSLAAAIKRVPIALQRPMGLDRAISSAGGVASQALDGAGMLRVRPGVFVAGEMLDWEAPTGGYLLQACFATGKWAATCALDWLGRR